MEEKFREVIFIIVVLMCFSSCTRNNKIAHFLQHDQLFADNDTLTANLTDIIGIDWDRMQVIGEWTPDWAISDAIGFEYKGRAGGFDITTFIFIKNNQVVYEERQHNHRRIFSFSRPSRSPHSETFYNVPYLIIRKTRDDGNYFFYLYPKK
jgi:hypothetical protein